METKYSLIVDVAGVGELLHVGAWFDHLPASLDVNDGSIYHVLQSGEVKKKKNDQKTGGTGLSLRVRVRRLGLGTHRDWEHTGTGDIEVSKTKQNGRVEATLTCTQTNPN